MAVKKRLKFEKTLLLEHWGKWIWFLRHQPVHAIHYLSGIFIPPHEALFIKLYNAEYKRNVIVASRGTSKSFCYGSLAAPVHCLLHKSVDTLVVSASGFRGGKLLFLDTERLFNGELRDQVKLGDFMLASINGTNVVKKDPSMWTITTKAASTAMTVPTHNEEKLRGIRATKALLDEANTMDDETTQIVIKPILNVGKSMKNTATAGDSNQFFMVSTIDFATRGFWKHVQDARNIARREYLTAEARKNGDWREYDRLMAENKGELKSSSNCYVRVDYTDLLIPQYVPEEQKMYKVNYPLSPGMRQEQMLRFEEREEANVWYTYPVDREEIERDLLAGIVDEDLWLAEQRNTPVSSSGNVFSLELIHKIAERPVWTEGEIPGHSDYDGDFYAPVMWSCADPCVVGIDYARESDEFALVVIRLGEYAKEKFNPHMAHSDDKGRPYLGKTTWNHIVWAESWKQLPHDQAADKIREIFARYNIIKAVDLGGMAMDQKGGGSAVRDELAQPKAPIIRGKPDSNWAMPIKIFDPEDESYAHFKGFNDPERYWGGLKLLNPQNQDNIDWTYALRALFQQKKLYIGHWKPASRWSEEKGCSTQTGQPDVTHPEFQKWKIGFDGILRLKKQLLRVQTKVTELGTMRFIMPGDRSKDEGKKDLFSASIYAAAMARDHLIRLTQKPTQVPEVAPVLVTGIGSDYSGRDIREGIRRML